MMIIAGGDSMVWGSELADSPHGGHDGYSSNTFAALLAKDNYVCAAYPGIGNKEIVQRIIEALTLTDPTGVLVCWTWPSRDNKIHSDEEIIHLQEYLEHYNIPYLFTCVDNCIVTDNPKINWDHWYLFPPGIELYETLQPRGFYQWAVENKYNIGPEHHPLEQAHVDAANLMRNKFNELVKKSNQSS